eukprot:9497412-Ditylum_brightwellii.AAC.1
MNLSNGVMGVFEHIGMMKENNVGDLVAVVCDYAISARYLAMYKAMIDQKAKVHFNANQKDGKLEAKIEYVLNTKIGSNRKVLLCEKNNAKNDSDIDSVIVKKFVNIPTLALEDRGRYLKKAVRERGDINRAILFVNKDRSSSYPA